MDGEETVTDVGIKQELQESSGSDCDIGDLLQLSYEESFDGIPVECKVDDGHSANLSNTCMEKINSEANGVEQEFDNDSVDINTRASKPAFVQVNRSSDDQLLARVHSFKEEINGDGSDCVFVGVTGTPPLNANNQIRGVFSCTACSLSFSSPVYLYRHKKLCKKYKQILVDLKLKKEELRGKRTNDVNEKVVKTETAESVEVIDGSGRFVCEVCGRELSCGWNLKQHMVLHTGTKTHVCLECGMCFAAKGTLNHHLHTHTGAKPHVCADCGARFSQRGNLVKHMRTHTEERPYKCEVCSAGFTQSGSLIRHKRIHSGEKPYACEICDARYPVSHQLAEHRRTHTGEKPYKCDVCEMRFPRRGDLTTHKRYHTGEKPYACDTCGKTFPRSHHLIRHNRRHTGEKPYSCDVCHARFPRSGDLSTHKRKHTGERPYTCIVCEAKFSRSHHLTRHKRTHR